MRRAALSGWGWPLWPALPLVLLGLWQAGAGLSIHLKALAGQVLLHRAWERTLAGEVAVRPWPWADTWPVARLRVPEHGIDLIVLEGATGAALAWGPGRLAGTAAPGGPGAAVLSAHRDTHFRFLERVRIGEEITVQTPDGVEHRYRITGTMVADHRSAVLPESRHRSAVTLVTCYPFDAIAPGGPLRYLVHAEAEEAAFASRVEIRP